MTIEITNLTKKYRHQTIFDNANLHIQEPDIYGLVAPNGYGKTTLLNIICEISNYQQGQLTITNDMGNLISSKEIAYLQNNEILYSYLTGWDHLKFICDINNITKDKLIETADKFEITSYLHKKVKKYSLGMKQRLLLSMALIKKPKILLLDEPLTGLDPSSTIIVRDVLLQAKNEGMLILVSSHDLNELDKLTNKIFFIENKKIALETIANAENFIFKIRVNHSEQLKLESLLKNEKLTWEQEGIFYLVYIEKEQGIKLQQEILNANINILHLSQESINSEKLYKQKYAEKERI